MFFVNILLVLLCLVMSDLLCSSVQSLLPGSWLSEVTPDCYKVHDPPIKVMFLVIWIQVMWCYDLMWCFEKFIFRLQG